MYSFTFALRIRVFYYWSTFSNERVQQTLVCVVDCTDHWSFALEKLTLPFWVICVDNQPSPSFFLAQVSMAPIVFRKNKMVFLIYNFFSLVYCSFVLFNLTISFLSIHYMFVYVWVFIAVVLFIWSMDTTIHFPSVCPIRPFERERTMVFETINILNNDTHLSNVICGAETQFPTNKLVSILLRNSNSPIVSGRLNRFLISKKFGVVVHYV